MQLFVDFKTYFTSSAQLMWNLQLHHKLCLPGRWLIAEALQFFSLELNKHRENSQVTCDL